jgi:uncharacterized protein (TIGR02271 family)
MNAFSDREVIAAHFPDSHSAAEAISNLKAAGFNSDQIGTSFEGGALEGGSVDRKNYGEDYEKHHRSFMDKMRGFFTGEEGYEERDTGAGDGVRDEGLRVGPTLRIPDRYNDRLSGGANIVTVHGNRLDEAERILIASGGTIDREFINQNSASNDRDVNATEGRRVSLLSEVLRVNKQRVQSGEVSLRKEVRTENQTIEVPVTHEELVIERVASEGRNATAGQIGSDQEIRVPLSEERVSVEKTPVVREEVRVGKRQVQDTQTVSDNVRHEELEVDDKTGRVRNSGDVKEKNKRIA